MSVHSLVGGMSVADLRGNNICHEALSNEIPVIDFGLLKQQSSKTARSIVIEDIKNACQTLGCFHVVNHGINKSVSSGALKAASDFFHLPAGHSDYGFVTILLQTCDGLQISHNNGDSWQPVHIKPGTLHVHLGDYMEVLSNGRYKSLVHRAVLRCEERISIASIHGYSMDEKVKASKELVDEQHPKRYHESSFRDFLDFISKGCNVGGKSFIQSLRIV